MRMFAISSGIAVGDLRLDHRIVVLELEQGGGDDVEVGGHRGHQRPAKAGSMPIAPITAGLPP